MRWMIWTLVAAVGWSVSVNGDEPQQRRGKYQPEEPLEVRTYPVADLVVGLPSEKEKTPNFAALERYLRDSTGAAAWGDAGSIQPYGKTLSLVIRQTASVHNQIADALSELRREFDAQVVLELRIVNGPRKEIAALADAFLGELGKYETEQLQKRVAESNNLLFAPKMTVFSGITAHVATGGADSRVVQANATVSADRRSVQLKIVESAESDHNLLARLQTVKLHSGRTAALRFEAPKAGGIIPPAADAEERLVIVTARVIVAEEEEEKLPPAISLVTPRGIYIQEEEEELLGIPTE